MRMPQVALLPDGRRLHLHDGPIDLVIEAFGAAAAVQDAYCAAVRRFTGLLDELVAELALLRTAAGSRQPPPGRGRSVHRKSATADLRRSEVPIAGKPEIGCTGRGSDAARDLSPDRLRWSAPPLSGEGEANADCATAHREGIQGIARGAVARRMQAAVAPFAAECFITPMAAVAGAVAEEILGAMTGAAPLARAYVNNGGDIAFHLAPGEAFTLGLVDRPDQPSLFARATVSERDPSRGIATSGWRGRSFSLGIADAVSVLAATAAQADAAATIIANAVDLPGHPAIARAPASSIKPDNDLGERLVTRAVGPLAPHDIVQAIASGLAHAENFRARGLVHAAAIHLQGETRVLGADRDAPALSKVAASGAPFEREFADA